MQRLLSDLFVGAAVCTLLALLFSGCGPSTESWQDVKSVTGKIPEFDYDGGTRTLESGRGVEEPFASGILLGNGRFEVSFLGEERMREQTNPVPPVSREDWEEGQYYFENFLCSDGVRRQVGGNVEFAVVGLFSVSGEDYQVIGLNSPDGDPAAGILPDEGVYVRWIYSTKPVKLKGDCERDLFGTDKTGIKRINLDLAEGWNEVIHDMRDEMQLRQYTDERPSSVEWNIY